MAATPAAPPSLTGGQKHQQRRGPVRGLHGGGRCPAAPPLHGERGRPAARRALPLAAAPARRPAPHRIPPPGAASSRRRRRRSGGGEPAGGSALPAGCADGAAGQGRSAALALLLISGCGAPPGPEPPGRTAPHAAPGAHNECRRRGCLRRAGVISPAGGRDTAPARQLPGSRDGPQSRDPPHPPADL
ncbi:PREDICTED: cuticle collagen 2C-like [Pseudopodoces humilis]|uniref:cuticle collagen 2C-like n=1 Tax=Pseudopodoces humilis TaxID=181119 RepID=UPI0003955D17|nr:PREDICTED: cuticle collagen 2C-like [Pseudopodoces humilis]